MPHRRIEKFVNPAESPSGDNFLGRYVRYLNSQMAEQLNFTLRAWRKVSLCAFGTRHLIFFAIPEKNRLTQSSSRRNHRSRRMGHGVSRIQDDQVIPRQPLQTQRGGCEVVQQRYFLET